MPQKGTRRNRLREIYLLFWQVYKPCEMAIFLSDREWVGLEGKIADTFNDIAAANEQMASELNRVGQAVGKEGKTRERTRFQLSRGAWGRMEYLLTHLLRTF